MLGMHLRQPGFTYTMLAKKSKWLCGAWDSPQRASTTLLEWSYHKGPQRSQRQERTCSWTGRMAKGNYTKKNTIAKSATH